ncbi:hypothetical protein DFA_06897 [Cavenderia fasciculata]|uniref:Transmembrane protein n=1 Tax=Cavenderia fasciculata TaxID=261658 RepID=F4PWZ2_CACFS|nr:uncharacterized protein DFA_06897 [Cavenderia fasciculata]EGG19795.1 hypothetical protein DFA_06897 [Cavenderia fasciculata]|eukprot:XP_004358141.1 hypothetical protein DFA_06897 [Cavenderia fasciculata]
MSKVNKVIAKVKKFRPSHLSPVKKDKEGKYLVCGSKPSVFFKSFGVIILLWIFIVGLFCALLYGLMDDAKRLRGPQPT